MEAEAESIQRTLDFPVNTKYIAGDWGQRCTDRHGPRACM